MHYRIDFSAKAVRLAGAIPFMTEGYPRDSGFWLKTRQNDVVGFPVFHKPSPWNDLIQGPASSRVPFRLVVK